LVLDRGNSTKSNPVNGTVAGLGEDLVVLLDGLGGLLSKHLLVFVTGHVGELVVSSDPGGAVGGVVLFDELVGVIEVLQADGELLDGVDGLAKVGEVVHVGQLSGGESGGNTGEGSNGEGFHL